MKMPSKQSRACANCHKKKIKCDISEMNGGSCTACQNLKIQCKLHIRKRRTVRQQVQSNFAQSRRPDARPLSPQSHVTQHSRNKGETGQAKEPSYLGRANYLESDVPINEEDASRYEGSLQGPTPSFDTTRLQALTLDDLMPRSLRESLLAAFVNKCLPWMPLLDVEEVDNLFRGTQKPSFLMLAILTAGCKVSTSSRAIDLGQICYNHAKVKFFMESEQIALSTVIATIFLQWWNGAGPEHVSINNSTFWLRIGVALAHQIGLHNEPDARHPEARLRRKLWWTLVSRDSQIATSHGRPRAIQASDCSIRPLSTRDFPRSAEDALPFISFVRITNILGDLTQERLRGSLSNQKRIDFEQDLWSWLNELPPQFHLFDRNAKTLTPYDFKARHLHVPFFVALIILFRDESSTNCLSTVSLLAASFISAIFEEYLDWGDIAFVSPPSIFYLLVATLVQVSSYRFSSLATHKEKETQISRSAIQQLKLRYTTAFGAERVIESIKRVSDLRPNRSRVPAKVATNESLQFFEHFGPGFALHWPTVIQPPSQNTAANMENGTVLVDIPSVPTIQQPQDETNHTPFLRSSLPNAGSLDHWSFQAESDSDPLIMDFSADGQDIVGQWWWSDFLEI